MISDLTNAGAKAVDKNSNTINSLNSTVFIKFFVLAVAMLLLIK